MDLLLKNLSIIENRWPTVFNLISCAGEPENVFLETGGRQTTLVIDGIHLSSVYDRMGEAELQAALVPRDSTEAWIYGPGLGQVPRVLLSRNRMEKLHVVVMNPIITKQCLLFFDQSDWLQDPRVNLLSADDENDALHLPFAAVPACLQLADDRSSRLRDLVVLELATPFIRKRHAPTNKALVERLEQNATFAGTDGDVAALSATRKDAPVVVAAAGPTLDDHYKWLLREKSRFTLVAVDAAFKPLVTAGIHPDIVVTIDMSLVGVKRFFEGFSLSPFRNTPLVYFPSVSAEVLNLWPGPRLTAYPDSEAYRALSEVYPKGHLVSSGSVLHPAVDLAVKMGANPIILLGTDFSYPGGKSHVKGSPASANISAAGHWVLNGNGQRVASKPNLRGYLRDLEQYIARHPEVSFINGSKKGAHIKGASYLKELL